MSDSQLSTLERAFQIARLGTATTVEDIRRTLKEERYDNVERHTAGTSIKRQLMAVVTSAKRDRLARAI